MLSTEKLAVFEKSYEARAHLVLVLSEVVRHHLQARFGGRLGEGLVLVAQRVVKAGTSGADETQVETILGHNPRWLRLPYWKRDGRTAWVLKESLDGAPITVGVVVEDARIAQVNMLTYGARHGRDVTRPGFLKQFEGASLTGHDQILDSPVRDTVGIGRPVDLMVGLARLALYHLTEQIPPAGGSGDGRD